MTPEEINPPDPLKVLKISRILKTPTSEEVSLLNTSWEPDELAIEEPLEIRVNHRPVSVSMRTPGNDEELALGFLLSEGIISQSGDWIQIQPYPRNKFGNVMDVFLNPELELDYQKLTRHVFGSSSCGLCGKATLDSILAMAPDILNESSEPMPQAEVSTPWLDPQLLWSATQSIQSRQENFKKTGGLHASAILSATGEIRCIREDVGRHNALDKVLGHALLQSWTPLRNNILWVSGRISFEILQKAWTGGIQVIAGVSAPSSLAVEFAKRSGQTLIGFLREDRLNVYAHAWRVKCEI